MHTLQNSIFPAKFKRQMHNIQLKLVSWTFQASPTGVFTETREGIDRVPDWCLDRNTSGHRQGIDRQASCSWI